METDSYWQSTQQLRYQILNFRHGERPTRYKQNMISFNFSEFSIDDSALNNGQEVSLYTLSRYTFARINDTFRCSQFINLIKKNHTFFFDIPQSFLRDINIRVHKFESIIVGRV